MLIVNGTNLSTHGFRYRDRRGPGLGGMVATIQEAPGGIPVLLGRTVRAGQLAVDGYWKGTSHANLLTRRDSIVGLLRGQLVLRFADITDREWVGYLEAASRDDALGAAEITTGHAASLVFALPDPAARAQAETVSATSPVNLVLGTAASAMRVSVTNNGAANITRATTRVRDAGVNSLRYLEWNGVLPVGSTLVIDAETFTVTLDDVNAIDGLTADSEFPVADPDEGAHDLTISAVGIPSGNVGRETRYRRRWW